jgi:hypothetical protein
LKDPAKQPTVIVTQLYPEKRVMKKIGIIFVAALALGSVTGCKKKGGDMMGKMEEFKNKMCACKDGEKECAQKVQKEAQEWSEANKGAADKDQKLSDEEQKKATDIGMEMMKCANKAMGMGAMGGPEGAKPAEGGDKPAEGAAPAAGGGDLPKECGDWKAAVEKLASCDKMPEAQRKAMKDAFDQASGAWANLPAEGKAALAQSCKAGADAIMQSAKATCGW